MTLSAAWRDLGVCDLKSSLTLADCLFYSKKGQIELDSNFFIGNALNVVWYFMVGGRKKLSEKVWAD